MHCEGVGIGLRPPHFSHILEHKPSVPWFEVHSCNYLNQSRGRELLTRVRADYPLRFHGVSLDLGGVDPISIDYLQRLKMASDELEPSLISDHACCVRFSGEYAHDLLPIPYSLEAIKNMVSRIHYVQDFLGCRIAIENISRYVHVNAGQPLAMPEGDFLAEVAQAADCLLVLDLNNAYVNSVNLQEDPLQFIRSLPFERICEIHLAGFEYSNGMAIDTHNQLISKEVFELYRYACEHLPSVPALIEWDSHLPDFSVLESERNKAQVIFNGEGGYA